MNIQIKINMNYKNIEPFLVKYKNGKINFKASISKYKKELNKVVYPVKDSVIIKIINRAFNKNKKVHKLCDFVLMNMEITPKNLKYIKPYVLDFIKKQTGKNNKFLLGYSKSTGYWKW